MKTSGFHRATRKDVCFALQNAVWVTVAEAFSQVFFEKKPDAAQSFVLCDMHQLMPQDELRNSPFFVQ